METKRRVNMSLRPSTLQALDEWAEARAEEIEAVEGRPNTGRSGAIEDFARLWRRECTPAAAAARLAQTIEEMGHDA